MIGIASLLIAFVLLTLLLWVGIKGALSPDQLEQASASMLDKQAPAEACPPELVDRVFARDDWEFVSKMKSPGLEALFQKERKAVAVLWVQQTALRIRQVMREHAKIARGSSDLEMRTEVRLLWQYAELMVVCAALFVLIQIAGPVWLGSLAGYAQSLSAKIAEAQRAFQIPMDSPETASVR